MRPLLRDGCKRLRVVLPLILAKVGQPLLLEQRPIVYELLKLSFEDGTQLNESIGCRIHQYPSACAGR